MNSRKYFLDWLRVLAFFFLIVFHVGCLYASWDYNLKSPRAVPGIDWALLVLSPWRMVLLFVISGVASRYLLDKLGVARFTVDRLRRLVPVILVGMFVVIPPQTYILLLDKGLVHTGYLHFWIFSYLAADQTLVAPLHRTMPTYDHLWFIVYLLFYTLIFALLVSVARVLVSLAKSMTAKRIDLPRIPLWLLLIFPAAWLIAANFLIERRWPVTFYLPNDWGSHLRWAGMFAAGAMLARREDCWDWVRRRRGELLAYAGLFLAMQFACRVVWLEGRVEPTANSLLWSVTTSLYACTMIGALCGFALEHINQRSAVLSYLNEAILPVYVLHQPILLISAYLLFPLKWPLALEATTLVAITGLSALAIYHLAIRPLRIMRILFGLKLDPREGLGTPKISSERVETT
jgi:glucan biosynthesis protein C